MERRQLQCVRFNHRKDNVMFGIMFRCPASLVLLLTGSLSVLAQDGLPSTATYRGEIRRTPDGRLTVQRAETVSETPAGTTGAGESGVAASDAASRSAPPARRIDPGPPDMSCLAGGTKLSPTERTLAALPADSWLALPGTAFRTFCKARESKALLANGDCTMVIGAWSGGVFDERLRRLLVIGGGHMDYWGNEVYGFDLASGTWTLVKPASGLGTAGAPSEPMADGNPVSRHTYDGLSYMRHLGQVFMFGGSTSPNGYSVNSAWSFDAANGKWQARAAAPSTGAGHFYMASAYDPVTRQVYVRNQHGFYAYDPDADRWSGPIVSFNQPPYYPRLQTYHYRRGVVLPAQRLFLAAGGTLKSPAAPDVFVYDLDGKRDVTGAYPMSGDTGVISVAGLGLDADARTGELVAWAGGAPAIMDTATWHWRRGSSRGAPPQAVRNGTYGRFRYIAYLNVFILVNKPEEDVHFYKLSAGCGKKDSTSPVASVR
jgi:hypothetical protein